MYLACPVSSSRCIFPPPIYRKLVGITLVSISLGPSVCMGQQVFAICAMRSIYTLVSHAISDLPYLKPAVALVLGFVGGKMFAEYFHYDIGVGLSLAVVSATQELPRQICRRLFSRAVW